MGCGTSLNQGQVNEPKTTNSEPQINHGKDPAIQHPNKQNQSKKQHIVQSLKEVKTQKSINYPADHLYEEVQNNEKVEAEENSTFTKRNPMDRLLLFGQSSTQRKIVHFNPSMNNPSFEILLSRSNNPPPMKYQPSEIILEQSQELCASHMYSSQSHPPYNFMFATFIDGDCSDTYHHKNTANHGLVFLCGGVNFDFNYLSNEAFLYNPNTETIQEHSSYLQTNTPSKSPQSRKRRIGNNLMGARFERLSCMKTQRYSHMGVYFRTGKLKYIYILGGRTEGDITINKCERYSFEQKKWVQIAPMHTPRSTGFAMIINKKIYAFGGYTAQGKRSKIIQRYNPGYDNWEILNFKLHRGMETGLLLPIPKSQSQIMLVGGNVELGALKSVIRINFQNETYIWDSDMKKERLLQKGLVISQQNSAYIFGGDFQDSVERYSFKDKSWKLLNNLNYGECISPDDINSFTMAQQTVQLDYQNEDIKQGESKMLDKTIPTGEYKYIFGSDDYPIIFELNTNKWVLKKKVVPLALRLRCHMGILKIKEGKYFIGGGIDSYGQKATRSAYIYYSSTNKAIEISKLNQKKYNFAICLQDQYIYVFGGKSKNGMLEQILENCERYNIDEDKWEQLPNMPRERSGCKTIFTPDNKSIMLIGGIDSSEQGVNQIDIFMIQEKQWKTLKAIIPIPLQIREIAIAQGKHAEELIIEGSKLKNSSNFQFLNDDLNQQQPFPEIEKKEEKPIVVDKKVIQTKIPLVIFNYNSFLKQYSIVKLLVDLELEFVREISGKQTTNKLFPYSMLFSIKQLDKKQEQFDVNQSIELNNISMKKDLPQNAINSNKNVGLDEDTVHYLISNKGVFKWKYEMNGGQGSIPQIVINQIYLLSMPIERFGIA